MRRIICFFVVLLVMRVAYAASTDVLPPTPYTSMYNQVVGLEIIMMYDEINKLYDEYMAALNREQSTANKLLGAAAIGAGGIGGMMLASGIAAQQADQAATRDMTAYIATFRCNYGTGQNIQGGETQIALPTSKQFIELRQDFINLATDLKKRKSALNMPPGLESETIINNATAGLYDDTSTGTASNAYTSVYRALTDSTSADAAALREQTNAAKQQTNVGAIIGGTGIIGGAVGNLLINRDDN